MITMDITKNNVRESDLALIAAINQTETDFGKEMTIPAQFILQAEKSPEDIAIEDNGRSITYCDLMQDSFKIAQFLNEQDAKTGELIAAFADRSIDLLASLLGIMETGAAYVPIDPNYPVKRIQYMLSDSKCKIVITESKNIERLLQYAGDYVETIICLDKPEEVETNKKVYFLTQIRNEYEGNKICLAKEDSLAYIIYTSGSTGNPKGVLIQQKAVMNTLLWLQSEFKLTNDDVIAQKTSSSFTDSVWEFFWPLICGAKISVFGYETGKEPEKLYQELLDKQITITQFVPAQMRLFLDYIKMANITGPLPKLKWVFNGGEALLTNLVRDWYQTFAKAKIANIYGMTESAIYATYYPIETIPPQEQLSIPLGKPIANAKVYVLDENRQICSVGEKGEICIGGTGITTGYLHKEEETEKAFVMHSVTGQKLYCTGDLGQLTSDGNFLYLGRKDDQVQVRGFRVELKEVERAVVSYDGIKETAVIPRVDSMGVTSIACYYTAKENNIILEELTGYLREMLPDYMIPSFFIEMDEMPLTPNGKIDRKKLSESRMGIKKKSAYVAPRNEREKQIAEIWANVLSLDADTIGIHDNFMDIGGTSVTIVTLHNKLKEICDYEIQVADLFSYSTIAQFMEHFENDKQEDSEMDLELMDLLDQLSDGKIDIDDTATILDNFKR